MLSAREAFEQFVVSTTAIGDPFYNLAYCAFGALQHGDDTLSERYHPHYNATIRALAEQNTLGIQPVQLYVVTHNTAYAFYLAHDALSATRLHLQRFGKYSRVTAAPRLLYKTFVDAATGNDVFLYYDRLHVPALPSYLGHAVAGSLVLERR